MFARLNGLLIGTSHVCITLGIVEASNQLMESVDINFFHQQKVFNNAMYSQLMASVPGGGELIKTNIQI